MSLPSPKNLGACLAVLAAAGTLAFGAPAPAAAARSAPVLEDRPCPVRVPEGTRCGYLVVPERRDLPGGRSTRVGFAVHRSTAPGRRPDPVVFTGGGPASASIPLTGLMVEMFRDHDVVVLEQRGSRWSSPSLGCPETVRAMLDTLATPGRAESETAVIAAGAAACRDRLGVDLRGYRTEEIAADVVDLRRALGYPRWNLFGVSYSTRSMLAAAAADPDGTRSVVLDSFLPASVDWYDEAARDLGDTIAKLAGQGLPGLPARFAAMVARLNTTPAVVTVRDPLTGGPLTLRLTGDDVATMLGEAMHSVEVLPIVPTLVDALAEGRHEVLQPLADEAGPGLATHEYGLYHAVQCQDEVPYNTFPPVRPRLFTAVHDRAVCREWKLPRAPVPGVTTRAPVLVVGGRYDPTTPTRTAGPAAAALPGARFVEFAGVGHAVFVSSRCGRQTIAAFVSDPAAGPPCDPAKAVYRILRPGELHLTPALYRAQREQWTPLPVVPLVVTALVQLGVALRRPRRRLFSLIAGASGLAFVGLTAGALYGMIAENEIVAAVGVPAAVPWYGLLAGLALAATVVAALAADRRPAGRGAAVREAGPGGGGAGGVAAGAAGPGGAASRGAAGPGGAASGGAGARGAWGRRGAHLLAGSVYAGFLAWWCLYLV
ncbi:alpha/beta fold hydrolase [Streptosporangium sp. NPDC023615]|uniref:alpha/beta fold hydrolase n=1 Tax=Streptosporangium sp. NPDC023615 TaxID=3154794 RepID=UPI00342A7C9F